MILWNTQDITAMVTKEYESEMYSTQLCLPISHCFPSRPLGHAQILGSIQCPSGLHGGLHWAGYII